MSRETVELVDGSVFWSDDHWVTVWKTALGGQGGSRRLSGSMADRVRFIALMAHGGGRDDATSPASRPRSGPASRASKRP